MKIVVSNPSAHAESLGFLFSCHSLLPTLSPYFPDLQRRRAPLLSPEGPKEKAFSPSLTHMAFDKCLPIKAALIIMQNNLMLFYNQFWASTFYIVKLIIQEAFIECISQDRQASANFLSKGPNSKYFLLSRP